MRLWPQTIMGRTLIVLLIGIVFSIVIAGGQQFAERRALLSVIGGWHGAERIADIVSKIELVDPEDRAALARSFETPGFRAAWSVQSSLVAAPLDWQGRQVRRALENFLGDIPPGNLRIERAGYRDASRVVPHSRISDRRAPNFQSPERQERFQQRMERFERMRKEHGMPWFMGRDGGRFDPNTIQADLSRSVLLISYRLSDGSWLTFLTPPAPMPPLWGTQFFVPSALSLLLIVGICIWAVRRATQPLGLFARAAERLGVDVNAQPMGESGPREVRRAAKAFNRMQRRLQAFVKDRTHMLAAISHDLRTPITRMRLRAEFVEDEEQREKMLKDLDEMETMIAATLQFARDDVTGEAAKNLDIAILVREQCDDAARSDQDVTFTGPDTLTYLGREVGLKRLVANLIGNAVRYGSRARVQLAEDGEDVVLTVSDDGPGIADDLQKRVFDPFYRVEGSRSRETGGTGLGLTAVKTIVQAHGGEIALNNRTQDEENVDGLDVVVRLPRLA